MPDADNKKMLGEMSAKTSLNNPRMAKSRSSVLGIIIPVGDKFAEHQANAAMSTRIAART